MPGIVQGQVGWGLEQPGRGLERDNLYGPSSPNYSDCMTASLKKLPQKICYFAFYLKWCMMTSSVIIISVQSEQCWQWERTTQLNSVCGYSVSREAVKNKIKTKQTKKELKRNSPKNKREKAS